MQGSCQRRVRSPKVDDIGAPGSYMTLAAGTPVYSSDGERLGEVEHVLAEPDKDIFDGIVFDAGGHRFVDAPEVERIHERGVVLALDAAGAERLPEPSENPATMSASPDDTAEGDLERKLRRAWDLISGRY
jgi:PRC-barrel domain